MIFLDTALSIYFHFFHAISAGAWTATIFDLGNHGNNSINFVLSLLLPCLYVVHDADVISLCESTRDEMMS